MKFTELFKNMVHVKGLVKTKRDVDFLKNYVNDNGLFQTKDFSKFRGLVTKISKYSGLIAQYKYKGVIDGLNNYFTISIPIDKNTIDEIKMHIKDMDKQFDIKKAIVDMVEKELPFLKISSIKIGEIDSYEIQFSIEI